MGLQTLAQGKEHSPDDPPGVEDTRDPAEDGEEDVDEQVGVTTTLEEHAELDGWLVFLMSTKR